VFCIKQRELEKEVKLSCPLVLGSQLQAANSVGRKRERKKGRCGGVIWE